MTPSMIGLLVFRTCMTTWLCIWIGHIIFLNVFYNYSHEGHVFYNDSHEGHVFYDHDICNYGNENMANMLFS